MNHETPLYASFALLAWLALPAAHATVPDMYGAGASNLGRAGASTALADDAWAVYYNPAGIARLKHITLDLGYVVGQAQLRPFERIVYDTDGDGYNTDAFGYPDVGPVGTDYRARAIGKDRPLNTDGLQLAIAYPLGWRFGIGLGIYLPREIARISLEDPALPYYVMYRNRNNILTLHPALGIQIIDGISLGLGGQISVRALIYGSASVFADIEAFPAEGSEDGTEISGDLRIDLHQLEAAVRPIFRPTAGLLINFGAFAKKDSDVRRILERFAVGATYRGNWGIPARAEIVAGVNGQISFDDDTLLLSSLLEEPLTLAIEDLLAFYNPPQVALGFMGGHGPVTATVDATWTGWSGFREITVPPTTVAIDAIAGASIAVNLGRELPPAAFRDTWEVRVGLEAEATVARATGRFGALKMRVRGGYGYVPTPVPPQNGLTNYMDADRHMIALGAGFEVGSIAGVSKGPVRFDLGAQFHQLERTTTVKDDNLVLDQDDDGILDYPTGTPLDGQITAAGYSWTLMGSLQVRFGDPTKEPRRRAAKAGAAPAPADPPPAEVVPEVPDPADPVTDPPGDATEGGAE